MTNTDSILREPDVKRRTGLSRTTRWAMVRKGTFPKPVKLTAKAIGWRESEIDAWVASRAAAPHTATRTKASS